MTMLSEQWTSGLFPNHPGVTPENCWFVSSAASQEDRSTEQDQDELRTLAEDRGGSEQLTVGALTSKSQSRRGGRHQSRKKSPTGKNRAGHRTSTYAVSPTPDVINPASDADARWTVVALLTYLFIYTPLLFHYLNTVVILSQISPDLRPATSSCRSVRGPGDILPSQAFFDEKFTKIEFNQSSQEAANLQLI